MPIFELFSKRLQKQQKAGQIDVYQYDNLPETFRQQVVFILNDALGTINFIGHVPMSDALWKLIHDTIAREKGVPYLGTPHMSNFKERCQYYLLSEETNGVLDLIDVAFRVIENTNSHARGVVISADDAITELNGRFREHYIGYQYEAGELIRVDSQYVHSEAVVPALQLLNDNNFSGPEEEFRKAHQFYRAGDNKEAIVNALKAFESTMKAIFDARSWTYEATAPASGLIKTLFDNELLPSYLTSQFTGVRTTLEAGLPTARNKTSGHGQGATPIEVPGYLAAYALHLTASNIVLLVEAHKAKPIV